MLKLFHQLKLFFEDVYQEFSVREYARKNKISPPTASKILKNLEQEQLLISSQKGIYLYFRAAREEFLFRQLARLYWYASLKLLTKQIQEEVAFQQIILFGSLAKAENTINSDVDLFINAEERKINVQVLERKLKRSIQLHFASSLKNENLARNIRAGVVIK